MSKSDSVSASLERLVDAIVSHQMRVSSSPDGSLYDTVAEAYSGLAFSTGQKLGAALAVAAASTEELSATDVVGATANTMSRMYVTELTSAAALVQLLSERVAQLTGTSSSAVLAEVLRAARASERGAA